MARTHRRLPPDWEGEECEFTTRWKRGQSHQGMEIDAAEGHFDSAWGPRGKRNAKKKKRRDNRRGAEKIISEQLGDLDL